MRIGRGQRRVDLQCLLVAALLVLVAGCGSRQQGDNAAEAAVSTASVVREPAGAVAPGDKSTTTDAARTLNGRFDPARNPAHDLQAAIAAARHDGKRIILDVGGEWCAWCKRMDAFVEGDADVRGFRDAHFVWMKVNYSEENENAAFLSQFPKVKGYPHLFVLDAEGRLLHSQFTGSLERDKGYDRVKFAAFLKQWASAPAQS